MLAAIDLSATGQEAARLCRHMGYGMRTEYWSQAKLSMFSKGWLAQLKMVAFFALGLRVHKCSKRYRTSCSLAKTAFISISKGTSVQDHESCDNRPQRLRHLRD